MALVVAILLALFVLPRTWGIVVLAGAVVYEVGTLWLGWHWSHTRPDVVGPEALVGLTGEVTAPCRPDGWVKVRGERWQARCSAGADTGARVRVRALDGLTLVVEPV